ncbi:hypothetical protein ASPSYDRAFT_146673 [Aspergillus sydowii CBS 593.65]|uniref:Uncharacterized protein n=1 Tax=Aspergillus sydowii CBS 593.65 TaxID=1036612 RepID=A0A1L9TPB8_9EURO|nr:uncharacterized protein ASPSYDRAFT_146673 [Aspergillus sydowii CBS 593.65]OJJ61262.1 hypothetical protein ASPSYDRAFT_146673 [Aspergillus sydowii CBS 593.65]
MSSPAPNAGSNRQDGSPQTGPEDTWHPARAWLEEDEEGDGEDEGEYTTEDPDEVDFFMRDIREMEDRAEDYRPIDEHYGPGLHLGGIQIEFAMDGDDHAGGVSTTQLLDLLASGGLGHLFGYRGFPRGSGPGDNIVDDDYDDYDDYEEYGILGLGRRVPRRAGPPQYPKVPSDEGLKLMRSGVFGAEPNYIDERAGRKKTLMEKIMWRELGVDGQGLQRSKTPSIAQGLIPGTTADKIIHYDARCYSGQFSDDGNFFFSCAQDFKVRMYDTSNPYEWRYYKTVDYPFGSWTITDATLSPDNKFLAYSSLRHLVCLAPTDPDDSSDPTVLDLASSPGGRVGRDIFGRDGFAIWSVRFSGDGREIVAGTGDYSVIVYDLETRQSVLRIRNHQDDVNAVCFGDKSSPHILYSGSDDSTIRVWDRRSMGDRREAGVFIGHTEGLTYVDSKGDGRYVLSNSKDQTMKLWDLRKMTSTAKFDTLQPTSYGTGFDYRVDRFPSDFYYPHPDDCSVVTFRGHSVLKTLIRCHFSPPGSSDSRYVYSGSQDGKVYVWNLDATLAGTMDVEKATDFSRPRPRRFRGHMGGSNGRKWQTCVRDASWHPNAPVLAATSWNGWGSATGTCTIHSWNDGARRDECGPQLAHGDSYDAELNPTDAAERAIDERAWEDEQGWDAWEAGL